MKCSVMFNYEFTVYREKKFAMLDVLSYISVSLVKKEKLFKVIHSCRQYFYGLLCNA